MVIANFINRMCTSFLVRVFRRASTARLDTKSAPALCAMGSQREGSFLIQRSAFPMETGSNCHQDAISLCRTSLCSKALPYPTHAPCRRCSRTDRFVLRPTPTPLLRLGICSDSLTAITTIATSGQHGDASRRSAPASAVHKCLLSSVSVAFT